MEFNERATSTTDQDDASTVLIGEVLQQFKAYSEKIYDQAVSLRAVIGDPESSETLSRNLALNLDNLKERMVNWRSRIDEIGRPLRKKDYAIWEEIEIFCEKVEGILALENFERQKVNGFHMSLTLPDLTKMEAKRQRTREERLEKQKKILGDLHHGANLESKDVLDELIRDLRRHETESRRSAHQAAQRQLQNAILVTRLKWSFLILALAFIPIWFFSMGKWAKNNRVEVNTLQYRKVMDVTRAFEQDTTFIAEVEPIWKELYEREKTLQIQALYERIQGRFRRLEVRDLKGNLLAEYRKGRIYFY